MQVIFKINVSYYFYKSHGSFLGHIKTKEYFYLGFIKDKRYILYYVDAYGWMDILDGIIYGIVRDFRGNNFFIWLHLLLVLFDITIVKKYENI